MGMALAVPVGREREAAAVASSLGRAARTSRVTLAGGGADIAKTSTVAAARETHATLREVT